MKHWHLSAGATGINFAGSLFVSTFSNVQFADTTIAVNVNGVGLTAGSRITMRGYSGPRPGSTYENDPKQYIDWILALLDSVFIGGD